MSFVPVGTSKRLLGLFGVVRYEYGLQDSPWLYLFAGIKLSTFESI